MTAEERHEVVRDIYQHAQFSPFNTVQYLQEELYAVHNNIGLVVLVRAKSEAEAIKVAEVRNRWQST